jgi:hypothetical protein
MSKAGEERNVNQDKDASNEIIKSYASQEPVLLYVFIVISDTCALAVEKAKQAVTA